MVLTEYLDKKQKEGKDSIETVMNLIEFPLLDQTSSNSVRRNTHVMRWNCDNITTVLDGTHKRTYIQQRLTESRAKDTIQRSK